MRRKIAVVVSLAVTGILSSAVTGFILAGSGHAAAKPVPQTVTRSVSVPRLYAQCSIGGTDFGDNAQIDWSVTVTNPGNAPQYPGSFTVAFFAGSQELNSETVTIDTAIMPGQRMTFPQDPFYKDGATSCTVLSG